MRTHPATRWAFAAIAVAIVAGPGPAAADFRLSVGGTYKSSSNETSRFDGTNVFTNDLPPLLDLDRLRGGTFAATFLFPDVKPVTGGHSAFYNFGPAYGMTFTLFDASGAAVHRGSSPSSPSALIFNDLSSSTGVIDQASLFAFVNDVTGLHIPSTVYTTDHGVDVFQSSLIFRGDVTAQTNYLNDLSIPTDAATYLRFPSRTFTTGVEFFDGDPSGDGPGQLIDTFVSYDITRVVITAVPEPGSALLVATGLVALGVASRARRRRPRDDRGRGVDAVWPEKGPGRHG